MSLLMLFASAPAFSPARLFAAGEKGYWWDFADFGTMFQDIAGTIPVTATGQPVGKVLDKSGNGNTIEAISAAARGVLQQDVNGFYYLDCDGIDDGYKTSAIVNHGSASQATLFFALKPDDFTNNFLVESSALSGSDGTYNVHFTDGRSVATDPPNGMLDAGFSDSAVTSRAQVNGFALAPAIVTVQYAYGAGTTLQEKIRVRRNGASTTPTYPNSANGASTFSNQILYILGRGGTQYFFDGRMYGALCRLAGSTAAEISDVETWYNTKRCGAF